MAVESGVEQHRLSPSDTRKRAKELINQRDIVTLGEFIEAGHTEGWDFGPGVDALDFVLARADLGKVELMQSFPTRNEDNRIFVVSRSLLDQRGSPTPK